MNTSFKEMGQVDSFHIFLSPVIMFSKICDCIIRVFRSVHKSDRSDISANVVDICLCVNIIIIKY